MGRKVSGAMKCKECENTLLTERGMCDLSLNFDYLDNLNRGGLKFPTNFSIDIGFTSFQVFQTIRF